MKTTFEPSKVEPWRDSKEVGKEVVSLRLPRKLWQEVKELSRRKGWTTTLAVEIALAELVQSERPQSKSKK